MAEFESSLMHVRTGTGVTLAAPSDVVLLTPYVLLEQETWFEDELPFLCRAIGKGARIVDVGASYGLYSISLAHAAGASGRVWSFEPASMTADYLRASAEANGFKHVEVIQKAVSNRPGTAHLTLNPNSELNSMAGPPGANTEEVPVDTLDALARTHGWTDIEFIKIDAEGEEARILEGGAAFFASQSLLAMFEIKHGEQLNLQLVELFKALGYDAYVLIPGLEVLVPFVPANAADPYLLNLFACKPDRAATLEARGLLATSRVGAPKAGDAYAHYRAAHDISLGPALRYAHLQAAHRAISTGPDSTGAYGLAAAGRMARELGMRLRAVELMNQALGLCIDEAPASASGNMLSPAPAFDTVQLLGRRMDWLKAALIDALVELTAYSTYFTLGSPLQQVTLDRLEALKASGYMRAPMERRRQLMRGRSGLQSGPEADPLVATPSPDNLNPSLWGGAAG